MVKRKDGRWQEQITVVINGRPVVKYFYGEKKSDVLLKISNYRNEIERAPRSRAFCDVAQEWWEQAEPELSPNTVRSYRPALNSAVAYFKNRPVNEITPADISKYVALTAKTKRLSAKTARTYLMIVNQICRYSVQTGDLPSNPARDLDIPRGLKSGKREIATDEDIRRVKDGWSAPFGMFAYWCLYTGLRRGELLALTWEDVDLERRVIHVRRSCLRGEDGKMHSKKPKTDAGKRDVPIPDRLAEKLQPGKGLVFPGESGYMTNGMFERHWRHYVNATGVTCTPHQLRHAYATMLYEAGDRVSLEDAQYLLGHAQLATTADIYTHIREAKTARIRDAMLDIDIDTAGP